MSASVWNFLSYIKIFILTFFYKHFQFVWIWIVRCRNMFTPNTQTSV